MRYVPNMPLIRSLVQRRIFGLSLDYRQSGAPAWEVSPAVTEVSPPALFDAEDLVRVSGVGEATTRDHEWTRVSGGPITHGATVAWRLREVELINGILYGKKTAYRLLDRPKRLFRASPVERIEQAAMASTYYGGIYFGHWMTDDLMLQLLAESIAEPVQVARRQYGHEPGYLELFDIQPRPVESAVFEELILLDDRGQNAHRRQRFQTLRQRLRRQAGAGNRRVYIRRGTRGALLSRSVSNPEPLEAFLEQHGFVIVDPDRLSAREMVDATLDAEIIVGVEGSHLAPGLFTLAEGGTLLILQPPYRFNNIFKDFTDSIGLNYAFVVGHAVEDGFEIDLGGLARLLDRLGG